MTGLVVMIGVLIISGVLYILLDILFRPEALNEIYRSQFLGQ